jgi:hypothetical protein
MGFINDLLRMLQTIRWMFVTLWRQHCGRYFYFRDCPDWFVMEMASTDVEEKDGADLVAYVRAAREEMSLRIRNLSLAIERAIQSTERRQAP